jgi:AraC-like DNA-binding protein
MNKDTVTIKNHLLSPEKTTKEGSHYFHDFTGISNQQSYERRGNFLVGTDCGYFQMFGAQGLHIWDGNIEITSNRKITLQTAKAAFQMIFCLEGKIGHHHGTENNNLEKSHHNLFYGPAGETRLDWQVTKCTRLVVISLSEEFFLRMIHINDGELSEMRQRVKNHSPCWLSKHNMHINQHCLLILQHLAGGRSESSQRRLFIEAKVLELLGYQLEQFQQMQINGHSNMLKAAEVEKMYLARSIILENLSKHYSLVQLAHQVGTNECYLKDHFKKVFGTTVYAFTQQAKMDKARELILAGGKKISEIAKSTGYKYTSHFTSSFKKHFGVLPNKIKLLMFLFQEELECVTMVMYEMAI